MRRFLRRVWYELHKTFFGPDLLDVAVPASWHEEHRREFYEARGWNCTCGTAPQVNKDCPEHGPTPQSQKVWIVQGWDEAPRAVFSSREQAQQFAEAQCDYETRPLNEDGTGSDTYPFIAEFEVNQ